jgi:hypothetical protein
MMALAVGQAEQQDAAKVVAHQPIERKVATINRGFAAASQQ